MAIDLAGRHLLRRRKNATLCRCRPAGTGVPLQLMRTRYGNVEHRSLSVTTQTRSFPKHHFPYPSRTRTCTRLIHIRRSTNPLETPETPRRNTENPAPAESRTGNAESKVNGSPDRERRSHAKRNNCCIPSCSVPAEAASCPTKPPLVCRKTIIICAPSRATLARD